MTVPTTNISMSDIKSEFGLGDTLTNYYGIRWFNTSNYRGYLQTSGPISFSDFAGKRNSSPVVAGSTTLYNNQTWTIPLFNNFNVTVVSGQGGQAGQSGNLTSGGVGGNGGITYFHGYVQSPEGPGGQPSLGGGSQASASFSLSVTDANQYSVLANQGVGVAVTIGGVGGGGGGGNNLQYECVCTAYCSCGWGCDYCCATSCGYVTRTLSSGAAGTNNGYVSISWS
jgi:hypothetical protein